MIYLHARIDVFEGKLPTPLAGVASRLSERTFAVLTLTDDDGTMGVGEASPLPGYSPESIDEAVENLRGLVDDPIEVDPSSESDTFLDQVSELELVESPSARFAFESALLDWLGRTLGQPVHRLLGGYMQGQPIPIADLVTEADPALWPRHIDQLVGLGATHVKLKIGTELHAEIDALRTIRDAHPSLPIRLDANRRIALGDLRSHAAALESLELELIEEPVTPEDWRAALALPLPLALDETLRDVETSRRLLAEGRLRAVVIKPTVVGGVTASLAVAELAAAHDAGVVLSHAFDGPIARAVSAELALALGTELAAGLGTHPALDLWSAHRIAAIRGRQIRAHDSPGLGLRFDEASDA